MKKQRIVIASVLKPVDDTRMLEKMAMTLTDPGGYEVFILGYPSLHHAATGSVHLLAHQPFGRLSMGRLLAPLKIFKKIYDLKPDWLIINTHELLNVALWTKFLLGARIIYDIRENYYRNVLHSGSFPGILRPLLAAWVRTREILISPFFDGFLLAEKGYATEMTFFGNRAIVIENKAIAISGQIRTWVPGKLRLLFSGTLAESTGVFEAIHLAKKLKALAPEVQLTIIGYCALAATLKKINSEIEGCVYITLVGGDRLVPHPQIVEAIFAADFGIICYPASPHTQNSIPTKLYEYLAAQLPILLQQNAVWMELCVPSQACISVDFDNIQSAEVLARMRSQSFYTSPPKDISWESEGQKLLNYLSKIKNP